MERSGRDPRGPGKRLTRDERLRRELELCDRWGIPHSQFRGIGDGTWTERDRAKAIAYLDYQKTVCPHCGTRDEDWDRGGDDQEDAYTAVLQKCVGCEVIADKQAELATSGESTHGMKIALIPVAVQTALDLMRDLNKKQHSTKDD
ncbi:hypothetical protein ACWEGQ_00565 [Streptomyces seoulensis]